MFTVKELGYETERKAMSAALREFLCGVYVSGND